jgi:26S proteasome regulatory subunit N3
VNRYVPNSAESFRTMTTCIEKVRAHEATLPAEPQPEGESKSDNNNNANANADDMAMDTTEDLPQPPAPTTVLPEVEVFLCTLCVTTLLRYGLHTEAAWAASILVASIEGYNRRSLDLLSSRAYFYYSLSFEKLGKLSDIRPTLLKFYRTTCVRRDEMGQAVLLNLLLRNYLHYNLIEGAKLLSARTNFPESVSNNQFCRCVVVSFFCFNRRQPAW